MSDSVNILSKLFDTLKDASEKNEQATQRLVEQQIVLVGKIKNMPIDELKTALKDHAKQSESEIDECNGTIELRTGEIKDLIKICLNKINKMLLVVSLTASIATGGYFIIRYMADEHLDINTLRQELKQERQEEQTEMFKIIKEEIKKLHSDKNNGGPK